MKTQKQKLIDQSESHDLEIILKFMKMREKNPRAHEQSQSFIWF